MEEALIIVGDMTMQAGSTGMRQLLAMPQPPDAVFSGSDFSAAGALEFLQEQGLRVPEDIVLVGFSNEVFSRLTVPKLTSIDQHCELMGRSATHLLLEIMQEQNQPFTPRHLVLQPDLHIRASSLRTGQVEAESSRELQ